ncbi:MAG TPA: hypothetical protein VF179_04350 [Thermoanaerobaculia bacterium]|nr:hypothetical protein [Thermoanaerobaculia bacterium]
MRRFHSKIHGALAILLLLLGVAVSQPVWAQEEADDPEDENQPAEDDEDKETCNTPDFSFTWQGYDLVKLTATADPAQAFIVKLNYLEPPNDGWDKEQEKKCEDVLNGEKKRESGTCKFPFEPARLLPAVSSGPRKECSDFESEGNGLSEGVTFCLQATENGSTASLYLDRKALLKAGGLVGLRYTALKDEIDDVCPARKRGPEKPQLKVLDKHSLNFDLGSVFNLQGDGSWETNAEVASIFRFYWYDWLQSGASVRYSAIGAVDEEEETDDDDGNGSGSTDDSEDDEFNPFESGGGVLETTVYIVANNPRAPRLGMVLGWGLSSVPGTTGERLETRERAFIGLRNTFEALNAGRIGDSLENTAGYIQAGLASDKLWEKVEIEPASEDGTVPAVFSDESDRYFFEGDIVLPRIGTEWFRVNLRLFASVPRSGEGPSDLRISALGSIDPRRWFSGLGQ